MDMPIGDIVVGPRFRKELGDIAYLAKSIRDTCLAHPIVIDKNKNLVAGQRRLVACKELGWAKVPVRIVDLENPLQAEHDENVCRKDFTRSEKVAIARAMEDYEKKKAAERRKVSRAKKGQKVGTQGAGKFPAPSEKGRAADKIAAKVGMDRKTLKKATAVVEAAEADAALRPVVEEMDRTDKVEPAYRKVKGKSRAGSIGELIDKLAVAGEAIGPLEKLDPSDPHSVMVLLNVSEWICEKILSIRSEVRCAAEWRPPCVEVDTNRIMALLRSLSVNWRTPKHVDEIGNFLREQAQYYLIEFLKETTEHGRSNP